VQSTDALSLAVELGQVLDSAGMPYAIGGALALGVHGVSRSTQDVDVNVFVKPDELERLLQVLTANGVTVDREKAFSEGLNDGIFFTWSHTHRRVSAEHRAVLRSAANPGPDSDSGQPTWFLSTELLSCFKLLFFRAKDLLDLERLVAANAELGVERVRSLIVEAMGVDDERVRAGTTSSRESGLALPERQAGACESALRA
jgi:hypothetical protein